jgi:hypothetical protein
MDVYLLWHVGHQNEAGPADATVHHDEDGTVYIDEQDGDDVKLLGVYSTRERAEERRQRARLTPGFQGEPECFIIGSYTLDRDAWHGGFIRTPHGQD